MYILEEKEENENALKDEKEISSNEEENENSKELEKENSKSEELQEERNFLNEEVEKNTREEISLNENVKNESEEKQKAKIETKTKYTSEEINQKVKNALDNDFFIEQVKSTLLCVYEISELLKDLHKDHNFEIEKLSVQIESKKQELQEIILMFKEHENNLIEINDLIDFFDSQIKSSLEKHKEELNNFKDEILQELRQEQI